MNKFSRFAIFPLLALILLWTALPSASGQQAPELVKGPYLQNVTQTSIAILWQTNTATPGLLEYGDPAVQVRTPDPATFHEVSLTGLNLGTTYPYRVSIDGGGATWTEWYTFTTAPTADQPFRIAVYGDSRSNPGVHARIAEAIRAANPALALHLGDLVYLGVIPTLWDSQFFGPAAPLMHTVPLYPVLGNHEVMSPLYFDFFSLPGNEQWYAFTYGSARMIALNTNVSLDPDSEQYRWLVSELQSPEYQAARWHIVFFHHPPFSSSVFGGELGITSALIPLFEQYGADLVLAGHIHNYERSEKDGITYLVIGGGGAELHNFAKNPLATNPYSLVRARVYSYGLLDISPEKIEFAAWDVDGNKLDSLTLNAQN